MKVNLRDLTLPEMVTFINSIGEPKYRAKQVFGWIYKGKTDFWEMKNLPEVFRHKLAEESYIGGVEAVKVQKSVKDGTRKYLFQLEDGNLIESVFMKYKYGNSICVSSQAGCRMGCKFCASTIMGLSRNLTAGEMVSQLLEAEKDTGEKINHIVVMGTGEPFDNYENVSKFIKIVNDKNGLGLGMRNITISTCGIVPKIKEFANDFPQVNLAISLHGSNDKLRESMMPINKSYPIESLLSVCREYIKTTGRRITFEYTLVKGKNDGKENAFELANLLKGILCHVNLIPLNKVTETGMDTVEKEIALEFQNILESRGVPTTIRRELGTDIDAACGQLRLIKK
ncbi:MAG: 23S rRNA (adenine(2503)-C(2))-methyltransferase RlmN [Eubacteriales bacterium]|nr:23S rRNA (adenine(2503)-C(2))-methyltransferase RlmN [Eubacteriales bacterium]